MKHWMVLFVISFIMGCAGSNGGVSTTGGRGPVPERTDPFYPGDMEASDDNGGEEGTPSLPEPPAQSTQSSGSCDNDVDEEAIEIMTTSDNEALNTCWQTCLFSPGDETLSECYSGCLVDESGFSQACATCFGDAISCEFDNCMECDGQEECDACMQDNCAPDFEECAGVPLPE